MRLIGIKKKTGVSGKCQVTDFASLGRGFFLRCRLRILRGVGWMFGSGMRRSDLGFSGFVKFDGGGSDAKGNNKARVPQVRSGYVPKHGGAAGLAPRNLLFPAWLPGTAQNFTPGGERSSTGIRLDSRR